MHNKRKNIVDLQQLDNDDKNKLNETKRNISKKKIAKESKNNKFFFKFL